MSVYHNDGSEMEGWPFILPLFIPGSVTSVGPYAVGDVDGDGELEVVVGEGHSPCVSRIFVLDSSGEIKPGWPIEVPDSEFTYDLALGDLDGDGDLEIITRNDADEHQVFAYQGDGSLVEGWPVTLDIDEDLDPRDFDFGIGELAVGDVDFDGRAEVMIGVPMPGNSGPMFLFNGDGTNYHHWPAIAGGHGSDLCIIWPIIADLDGDFVCEIVGMANGSVFAYSAERRPKRFLSGPSGLPSTGTRTAAGDLDGDGDMEVVSATNKLRILDIHSEDITTLPDDYPYTLYDAITLGDTDGDGDLEIAAISHDIAGRGAINALHLFDHNLNPLPGFPIEFEGLLDTSAKSMVMVDLDGDGDIELIHRYKDTLHVWDLRRHGAGKTLGLSAPSDRATAVPADPAVVVWGMRRGQASRSNYWHEGQYPGGLRRFQRGNVDRDRHGRVDLGDAVQLLSYVAGRGNDNDCPASLDVDDDDDVDVGDATYLLRFLLLEGRAPPPPFVECGVDLEGSALDCVDGLCPP